MEGGEEPIEGGELGQLVDGEGVVGSGIVHGGSSVLPSTDGISTGVSHVLVGDGDGVEPDLGAHAIHGGAYGHGFATGTSHELVHMPAVIHGAHVLHVPSYVVHHPVGAHYVHHYTTVSHKTVAVPVPAPVKKVKTLVRNHYGTVYRTDPSASRTPYPCKLRVGKADKSSIISYNNTITSNRPTS